ncbi:toll/interleukin-1 receptor domain-containing protein [Variovorax sp. J22R133]|uniref:toll/interleukin-1 receptor domain-containing protein n=1 Tax=Variovorax brevis TaxID=3053503 RepID=UPI0025774F95|nr:toll/interleukin-1 receptor domain-containing protein [Variovorax sp. J22R133]MDM0110514.1 toll/interleukin-1 receptor domain-containing protein [Variovorax sp. J22R133]
MNVFSLTRRQQGRQVFISFKSEQRNLAAQLRKVLLEFDYSVWWQEDIQCGKEWHGDIDAAILAAGCIVVIWSEAAMQSPWVQHEASQAIARGVYAPVKIDGVDIATPFNRNQATDLSGWKGERDDPVVYSLLRRIEELIPTHFTLGQRIAAFLREQALPLFGVLAALSTLAVLAKTYFSLDTIANEQRTVSIAVQQSFMPINFLEVRLTLKIDERVDGIAEYRSKLERQLPAALSERHTLPHGVLRRYDGTYAVLPSSTLWPTDTRAALLDSLASVTIADLFLCWREAPNAKMGSDSPPCSPDNRTPDLKLHIGLSDTADVRTLWLDENRLLWNPSESRILLLVVRRFSGEALTANNHQLNKHDLEHSTLSLSLRPDGWKMNSLRLFGGDIFNHATLLSGSPDERSKNAMREMAQELTDARRGLAFDALQFDYLGQTLTVRSADVQLSTNETGLQVVRSALSPLSSRR